MPELTADVLAEVTLLEVLLGEAERLEHWHLDYLKIARREKTLLA